MNKHKLLIVGTGGEGREAAWIAERMNNAKTANWEILGFLDDNAEMSGKRINGYPVLGTTSYLSELNDYEVVVAIGYPQIRRKVVERIQAQSPQQAFATLIDPSVIIPRNTRIGSGCILSPGAIVSVNVKIDSHVLIGSGCIVGHDDQIHDYATLFPGSCIAGNVELHSGVLCGARSSVIQGLTIGENAVLGAGAVVIREVESSATMAGVPAKNIH